MFRLTSTTFAPWVVLESDDKRYARIKALRIIVEALEKRLGRVPRLVMPSKRTVRRRRGVFPCANPGFRVL